MSDRDDKHATRHNDLAISFTNVQEAITRSRDILSRSVPDTFLGRPHHEAMLRMVRRPRSTMLPE